MKHPAPQIFDLTTARHLKAVNGGRPDPFTAPELAALEDALDAALDADPVALLRLVAMYDRDTLSAARGKLAALAAEV